MWGICLKFAFPKIQNATVTSMSMGSTGAIKEIRLDCFEEEIDLSDLQLDLNATVVLNRIITWDKK